MIRERELFIEWAGEDRPHSQELLDEAADKITILPGKVAVIMDPPRLRSGEIIIPDEVGRKTRPDFGTVVASGIPSVAVGMRVAVRPYKGMWVEELVDGYQIRFYGVHWHWEHCLVASWNGERAVPFADWMLIDRPDNEQTDSGLYIANSGSKDQKELVKVVAVGPWVKNIKPGDMCYVASGPNDGLRVAFADFEGNQFIKYKDEDGFQSAIAVLEA